MNESGIYNESDLAPFHRRIAELRCVSAARARFLMCRVRSRFVSGYCMAAACSLLDVLLEEEDDHGATVCLTFPSDSCYGHLWHESATG